MRPRLIRNLRRSLIGLIILVLLAVAFNYMHIWHRRARSVQKAAQILGSEMVRSFNRIEYSEYQKGVLRFKISAARVLESREGKSFLEGIEAYDLNPDGSVHNEIHSKKAEYDRDRKICDFTGDVRLFLGKGFELRMNSLHYDLNTNVGTTEDKIQFISEVAGGSARGIRFDQNQETLDLKSEVNFVLTARNPGSSGSAEPEKFHAISNRAYCSDQMRRLVFQGSARIESKAELLSGDSIEAVLSPERRQVTSLISAGNAVYKAGDANGTQTLSGNRMLFGIGDSQALERIRVEGQGAFSSSSAEGEEMLQAGEIDLAFDGESKMPGMIQGRNGVQFSRKRNGDQMKISGSQLTAAFVPGTKFLETIDVQKKADLIAEGSGSDLSNELQADEIKMRFRQSDARTVFEKLRAQGSARWISKPSKDSAPGHAEPARILTASSLEMLYSAQGDSFDSGHAAGGVVISETRVDAGASTQLSRLFADRVQFHFFPGNNQIRDMDADGHVRVTREKKAGTEANPAIESFRTASDNMKVLFYLQKNESAVDSMAQWGSFRYEDASMSATAGRCDYDARKERLVLRESPRISNEMNSTTGEWMEYDQAAGLLRVHGRVRSVLNAAKGKGSFFTSSSSSSSPAIVTADEMQYWQSGQRARYSGKVQLLSENGQLQAGELDIIEGGERVEAEGGIRHFIPERAASEPPARTDKNKEARKTGNRAMVIQASSLKYLRGSNSITYVGNVSAHSADIDMSSESLDVLISEDGRSVEHATARGKVVIRQGGRLCKGDTAEYFLNPQKFVIVGNPAEVDDPEKGKSFARRLTSFIADDRILLENR